MTTTNPIQQLFFWLSGAGSRTLAQCPDWEQRKYVAFGATVLVPTLFGFIACTYALSTITENWSVILPVATAWAFIIMTIDRALLSIYRAHQSFFTKVGQFFLRILVAALMGITISHPLTLLLFRDTISATIEEQRQVEIAEFRTQAAAEKGLVEDRIATLESEIDAQRDRYEETFSADFIVADATVAETDPVADLDPEMRARMEEKIASDTAADLAQIATLDKEMAEVQEQYAELQTELDYWQREFEREVNGQRSGLSGVGPRAKSIRDDQLAWRRDETDRLGDRLEFLTTQHQDTTARVEATKTSVESEFVALATERASRISAERERVAALRREVQGRQAEQFIGQQNALRETISRQIDVRLEELDRLQGELAQVGEQEQERIAALAAEPRRDLLTQTLALHGLFHAGEHGGHFALTAYLVLAFLFLLIDTIPLVVKFFSSPGPYDCLVDCESLRFAQGRLAWRGQWDDASPVAPHHLNSPRTVTRPEADLAFIESLLEDVHQSSRAAARPSDGPRSTRHEGTLEHVADSFNDYLRKRMRGADATDHPVTAPAAPA